MSQANFHSIFMQVQDLRPTSLAYEIHTLAADKAYLGESKTRMVQGCYSLLIDGSSVSPDQQWDQLHCEITLTDLASYLVAPEADGATKIGSLGVEGDWGIKGIIQVKPAIMRDMLDYFRFLLVVDENGRRKGNIVMRLDISDEPVARVDGEKYLIYRLALEDD